MGSEHLHAHAGAVAGQVDAARLFSLEGIIPALDVGSISELQDVLVTRVVSIAKIADVDAREKVAHALMPVEVWRSSEGSGVACYHGVTELVGEVVASVAVLKTSMPAARTGEPPIQAAVVFVGPRRQSPLLVKLCAEVGRLASDTSFTQALFAAADAEAIRKELSKRFANLDVSLHARDVMREPFMYLTPEAPLAVVVRHMLEFNVEAIGIVDGDKRIVGEVTSDRLFKMGMPDFFSQLRSVAFVGDFDPFEKYFEKESGVRTADVMSSDFAAVTEEAPILEVLFFLAVRRHVKVYVVRDGKMIGVIDRMRVLQKVLGL